jgi:pimeloyl-ACP methyl ester carboxylesterase
MINVFILLLLLILVIACTYYINRSQVRVHATGSDEYQYLRMMPASNVSNNLRILFISGLGDGKESYNWNLSTETMRKKTGLPIQESFQEKITNMGYETISFDPPGYGDNAHIAVPCNAIAYCNEIHNFAGNADIVIGHSIGARIAQMYVKLYGGKLLMVDPTPDYIMETAREMVVKYTGKPIESFLRMIDKSFIDIKSLSWENAIVIYVRRSAEMQQFFDNIKIERKIVLESGSHWIHIEHPDLIIQNIAE